MVAIKHILLVVLVVFAILIVAGCADNSGRDSAQEKYDQVIITTNERLSVVNDLYNRFSLGVDIVSFKEIMPNYYSNLTALQNDVNASIQAGEELKKYLKQGSDDYETVTANEQSIREQFNLFVRDYNQHVESYNNGPGLQDGTTMPLFA
jgi:hypothetical protein